MHLVSGVVNLFLLGTILWLGRHDMNNAVYEIPAMLAVVIGWVAIFRSGKRREP
ncbi:hypothetical protein [Oscillibacter sp.]|uniref:hypothetical protein n=1 Tax=Oscillibacter sp. TaxID=1945593 RepID=UPI00260E57A7|nr:hypothetical protein [Oscillibacter sp.]MDD3346568.1 hypothetical protein [Oscillibacter sp.]